MTFKIDVGPPPPMLDPHAVGLGHGRKARGKATLDTIAKFTAQMQHKKDPYTKGFLEGLNEKVTHG